MKLNQVVRTLFPSILAWWTNREVLKDEEQSLDEIVKSWEGRLKSVNTASLQHVVDDIYNTELHRKETMESKAASLFGAIGFAASILSIFVVFFDTSPVFLSLLLPLLHFIIAGLCSWMVGRVEEYHFFSTPGTFYGDLEAINDKSEKECKKYWIAQKLASTKINSKRLLVKSNWLSAAHQHFLLGIVFVIPMLALIIYLVIP